MYKRVLFATLLVLVLASSLMAKGVDPLWTKAQDISNKHWNLVPGKFKMTSKVTGPQSMTVEIHLAIKQTEEGLETEFIQGVMGDEEIAADHAAVAQILMQDFTPKKDGIFFAEPAEIKLKRKKKNKDIEGTDCAVFTYKKTETAQDGSEVEIIGTVFVDAKTGQPVMEESTMFPLPQMISAMKNTSYFKTNSKGLFFSNKAVSETVMEFGGQKMENTTTMKMLKHFEYIPPSEDDMFEE